MISNPSFIGCWQANYWFVPLIRCVFVNGWLYEIFKLLLLDATKWNVMIILLLFRALRFFPSPDTLMLSSLLFKSSFFIVLCKIHEGSWTAIFAIICFSVCLCDRCSIRQDWRSFINSHTRNLLQWNLDITKGLGTGKTRFH